MNLKSDLKFHRFINFKSSQGNNSPVPQDVSFSFFRSAGIFQEGKKKSVFLAWINLLVASFEKESSSRVCPSEVSAFDRTRRKGRRQFYRLPLSFLSRLFHLADLSLPRQRDSFSLLTTRQGVEGRDFSSSRAAEDLLTNLFSSLLFSSLLENSLLSLLLLLLFFFFFARDLNQFPVFFVKSPIVTNFPRLQVLLPRYLA